MNRFKIALNRENDFENIWKKRETHLNDVPGFIEFHLVKGKSEETHTLYASHSTWNTRKDFENWTKSEAFRKAHKGAGEHSPICFTRNWFALSLPPCGRRHTYIDVK